MFYAFRCIKVLRDIEKVNTGKGDIKEYFTGDLKESGGFELRLSIEILERARTQINNRLALLEEIKEDMKQRKEWKESAEGSPII